jgi:nucleoside-diphosphate kinase
MALERTLSIVKPDGIQKKRDRRCLPPLRAGGTLYHRRAHDAAAVGPEAEGFYAVHRERPFFRDLAEIRSRVRSWCRCSRAKGVARNREIMGATDPKKAAAGTIRADLATRYRAERRARLRQPRERSARGSHTFFRRNGPLSAERDTPDNDARSRCMNGSSDNRTNLLGLTRDGLGSSSSAWEKSRFEPGIAQVDLPPPKATSRR